MIPQSTRNEGLEAPPQDVDAGGGGAEKHPRERPLSQRLGLALSGGGSRAAAFHRGIVQGLLEVPLPEVDVISTVSGGSIFGAAWMAARARAGAGLDRVKTDKDFLEKMGKELCKGFVARSLRPLALLRLSLPRYTRTNVIAETFDRIFFQGLTLKDLPEFPRLCINTTVLNHAQVGKFSRDGFRTPGVNVDGAGLHRVAKLPDFSVALAAAASAAFPVGLPPLFLRRRDLGETTAFSRELEGHETLALSDGGVLENLGVQTLLATTGSFGTCDLIISDAGARELSWKPGEILEPLKTFGMAALSAAHLVQVTLTMNNKQNRSMRSLTMRELEASWLCEQLRDGSSGDPVRTAFLEDRPAIPRRKLLFVRLEQDFDSLLSQIPTWRLTELWLRNNPGQPVPGISRTGSRKDPKSVREFLEKANVDLREAFRIYEALGQQRIQQLQDIPTHFTALAPRDVEGLAEHARWQLHAMRAIYW